MTSTALVTAESHPVEYAMGEWMRAKVARSGSERTQRAYTDAILTFRFALQRHGMDLDSDPARVADKAQEWAGKPWGLKHQTVSAATHNQRLAIISSFYEFARKRRILPGDNPVDLVERRKVQDYAAALALDTGTVAENMAAIDRERPDGKRDYALLSIALYTGRRLAELANIRWGDIAWAHGYATVTFPSAKGGKKMTDLLPVGLSSALLDYVQTVHGPTIAQDACIWISLAHYRFGEPLSRTGIADICRKHLGTSRVHSTRHTWAHAMVEAGAPVTEIQQRLGHSNLATTSRYLTSLQSAENKHGDALVKMFGLA
jgi:integrase